MDVISSYEKSEVGNIISFWVGTALEGQPRITIYIISVGTLLFVEGMGPLLT